MGLSIHLKNTSKKYVNEWIFRKLTVTINPSDKMVILGSNGSGKSTLLQTIASYIIPTQGKVEWKQHDKIIEEDNVFKYLSMASPYMELVEDFTLRELIEHQKHFKPFAQLLNTEQIIEILQLTHAANKFIKHFSSGMKQRVKLGLAILADCPVLLLDEPCSNLDSNAIVWYKKMIDEFALQKTIIVCSNTVQDEYSFCDIKLEVEKYKTT